jgi:hypothetical protein
MVRHYLLIENILIGQLMLGGRGEIIYGVKNIIDVRGERRELDVKGKSDIKKKN